MSGRNLSATFPLLLLTLLLSTPTIATSSCAAAPGANYPREVLRIRGGLVFPDPDQDPGPGRSVGAALGLALNRSTLISLNYDHVDLDVPASRTTGQTLNPVTVQLELGMPYKHRITPRFGIGAGIYHLTREFSPPRLLSFETERSRSSSYLPFGMNFGGGVSVPLWKRTALDVDTRYHQTMGRSNAIVVGTVSLGLSYTLR